MTLRCAWSGECVCVCTRARPRAPGRPPPPHARTRSLPPPAPAPPPSPRCSDNRVAMDKVVEVLLEKETLSGDQFREILAKV